MANNMLDFVHTRMMVAVVMFVSVVMMMVVHMLIFLLTVYRNFHMCARDTASDGGFLFYLHARYSKTVEPFDKTVRIGMQLQQGRQQHIARRTHIAFYV